MAKSNAHYNKPRLIEYLNKAGVEYFEVNEHQIRVMGATHIIDIWPARMTVHRISGERIDSIEPYKKLSYYFNEKEVKALVEEGKL